MNKTIAYIFFIAAAAWLVDGIYRVINTQEVYKIIFHYTTENKYYFLIFKVLTGLLIISAGIRRWKMSKQ